MGDQYVPQPYPKWVSGVVVKNEKEERAVLDETAILHETKSAQGSTFSIVGFKAKAKGKKA